MDIIKQMLKEMSQKDTNTIYLREIALLMEQNDTLKEQIDIYKDELRVKEKLIKTLELGLQGKKSE